MARWLYWLLLFAPVAVVARILGLSPIVVFACSAISLIPLAGLIGHATEELAHHLGPRYGGLLNATFGNAAELIITLFALQRGLITLVKASITGAIIGNTLLILGLAVLAGGLKNGRQRYDPRDASVNAAMMILAVAALYMPATFAHTAGRPQVVESLSMFIAVLLLVIYGAYLAHTLLDPSSSHGAAATVPAGHGAAAGAAAAHDPATPAPAPSPAAWTTRKALSVLAAATVGTAVVSEMLVAAVEPVTHQLGWSEFFVGVIIVPLVGNAAEHFSAVVFAWRNRLELGLAIAAGSSTQIALLVAPLLVFLSLLLGHPMDLIFTPLELVILGLATAIFAYICLDGEANWLEGAQLLALYVLAATVFFFVPQVAGAGGH